MSDKASYVWLGILIVVTLVFVVLDHCEATPISAIDEPIFEAPYEYPQVQFAIEGRDVDMTVVNPPPPVDLDDLEERLRRWMPEHEVQEHMRRLRDAGD